MSFGPERMRALLGEVFAPWVQALDLRPERVEAGGAVFTLPENPDLARGAGEDGAPGAGVLCGQAIGAAADTASVLTLSALNGRFRNCTTVDITTHFLRPLMTGDVEVRVTALSNGRRMATTRAEFRARGGGKLAATTTCAFVYLED